MREVSWVGGPALHEVMGMGMDGHDTFCYGVVASQA